MLPGADPRRQRRARLCRTTRPTPSRRWSPRCSAPFPRRRLRGELPIAIVTTSPDPGRRFTADMLAGLDEPVRRYFTHAISDGARSRRRPHGDERAHQGRPLAAVHRRADGRRPILHVARPRRARAADAAARHRPLRRRRRQHRGPPARARDPVSRRRRQHGPVGGDAAAIESVVFAPPSVLPDRGVAWRAETEHVIVARFDLPPERPEVRAAHRRPRRDTNRQRPALGQRRREDFQYIPFGGESTPSAASATSCFPAARASAGGSTPRATRRSSMPRSARSRQRSRPRPARRRGGCRGSSGTGMVAA